MYYTPDGYKEKKKTTWYLSVLLILIPVFVYSLSMNVAVRLHDVYDWKLEQNNTAAQEGDESITTFSELHIYVKETVFCKEISDFMKHKAKNIETVDKDDEFYEYYSTVKRDLTENDYHILKCGRAFVDVLILFCIIGFVGSVLLFFRLQMDGYEGRKRIRRLTHLGMLVWLALEGITFLSIFVGPIRHMIYGKILGIQVGKHDILYPLFGDQFVLYMAIAAFLLSIAIMLVLYYVIRITTKPRDIFNERRYFR